jgi:predicted nucleic acid-binding protein
MPEKPASVAALLLAHRQIAIDSNVLIYLLEGSGPRAEVGASLVDAVARREVEGVLASVAISEVLLPAARAADGVGFEELAATIRDLGFRIVALDAAVAEDVAWIRGRSGIPMADAIHLACARSGGATAFVTNDRRMPGLPRLELVLLDDLVA